jgi:hypothetical protein
MHTRYWSNNNKTKRRQCRKACASRLRANALSVHTLLLDSTAWHVAATLTSRRLQPVLWLCLPQKCMLLHSTTGAALAKPSRHYLSEDWHHCLYNKCSPPRQAPHRCTNSAPQLLLRLRFLCFFRFPLPRVSSADASASSPPMLSSVSRYL